MILQQKIVSSEWLTFSSDFIFQKVKLLLREFPNRTILNEATPGPSEKAISNSRNSNVLVALLSGLQWLFFFFFFEDSWLLNIA